MTHALVAGDAPERTPGADGPAPRALLDAGLTRFARYGATADRALTEHDEHAEQAVAGVGVMGGGLREPELLPRFQTAAHLVGRHTPRQAIALTRRGSDSTQATLRRLPGITTPDIARSNTAGTDVAVVPDVAGPDLDRSDAAASEVAESDLAGLRNTEPLLPRRKTAAHLARPQTPQTAITFTTSGALEARGPHRPGDSRQAASRHLPGITAPDNGGSDAAGSDVTGSDVPWPDVVGVAIAAPEVAAPDAAGRERASR
ncbi:hypothetical protein [Streptomyces sp. NRRL F-5630]|uniref:hypothetical protein n=1 Tax=Streptomyces sp. NRRL F-5630 TaxID=1463864 RepID=UPI003EBDED61